MIFFTDIQTDSSQYCLLNVNKYNDPRKLTKKIIFVDPGVMELRKSPEYSKIEFLHRLAAGGLATNEYVGIDYPSDMNESFEDEFIQKSKVNNRKYADNPQYICGIQYKWQDINDFKFRMNELAPIYAHKKKIVGLGNLCRIMNPNKYFDGVINYIITNKDRFYWIHIYGMSLACIKKYVPLLEMYAPNIIISVDSTKWTQPCTNALKNKYMMAKGQQQLVPKPMPGRCCSKETRDEFFLEYIKAIQKRGIQVKY